MKWILIGLLLGSWDNHVVSHHDIASFDSKLDCENARDAIKKAADVISICANQSMPNVKDK